MTLEAILQIQQDRIRRSLYDTRPVHLPAPKPEKVTWIDTRIVAPMLDALGVSEPCSRIANRKGQKATARTREVSWRYRQMKKQEHATRRASMRVLNPAALQRAQANLPWNQTAQGGEAA